MTFLRVAAAAACSGSTAGISRKTAVCKFPGHSGQCCFCLREEVVRHVIWFRQGRHRTKSLRILCNIYSSRKQMNFAPRVLYRVLFAH